MTHKIWRSATLRLSLCSLSLPLLLITGCGDLLTVPEDPTQIEESQLNDAQGAELLRRSALRWQNRAVTTGALSSGLLTDEFMRDGPPVSDPSSAGNQQLLDMRQSALYELNPSSAFDTYLFWQLVREAANVALPKLEAYAADDVRGPYMGHMLALRGFASLRLAEYMCPGFPLHDVVDYKVVVGPPLTTEQALERALADLDSAVTLSVDSVRILNLARIGRARTLLNLGRYSEAAAAASGVPTGFVYNAEYSTATGDGQNVVSFVSFFWGTRVAVSDREGGRGLDFVSANDPRAQTTFRRLAVDRVTRLHGVTKYPSLASPIVMVSGVEARLIEAEAALQANDAATWLAKLNELRRTAITPALADTTDPGTQSGRVDLTFRERAFWLFATGSRLGDLRRLIRHYGRPSETVFPTGAYRLGNAYGTATSIPFPARLETPFNSAVTGCTTR